MLPEGEDDWRLDLAYWEKQLSPAPAALELPTDYPRLPAQTFHGARQPLALSPALTRDLKALSQREGVTLFTTLLAAFKALLCRYTGQTDIVVGAPIANRAQAELAGLTGCRANTLVLRTHLGGNPTFRELLGRVREVTLGAYAHPSLPFEKLVEELRPERDRSRSPLFQVMFILQDTALKASELPGLTPRKAEDGTTQFDLTLSLQDTAQGLCGTFEYNTDLFDDRTIVQLVGHFQRLLDSSVADPDQRLADLTLLSEAERRQLVAAWNDTRSAYPRDACVHELFEAQVARTPEAVAVTFEDQHLTYQALNRRANQLAHYLQQNGVGPEAIVGVCTERSVEMIVALLGILKAGGAYLPLDPCYPTERLTFMQAEGQVSVLLTQQHLLASLPPHHGQVFCLDREWQPAARECESNLMSRTSAQNLAYVMYTSGSTGRPKGISVTHQNIVRLVKETNYARFGADEIFLQLAPLAFDASTLEVWGALLNGGRLVVFPAGTPSLEELGAELRRREITTLWLTAGLFHQMVDYRLADLGRVRQLLAGGDVLSAAHVLKVLRELPNVQLINGYGPTENTTFTCCYRLERVEQVGHTVSIGRPIANTCVYVLDGFGQPAPVGVVGELYIGGAGLARGYLGRPELTAERFVPDPFGGEAGARLYRTGDRARYRPDGNIEFLGRLDHQVKIRGYRIELGEIEAALNQHPAVREAVVVAREDQPGNRRLVAYLVPNAVGHEIGDLRRFLHDKLPEYMLPSAFAVLEALPLMPNGKVDRRALPAPEQTRPGLADTYAAPRTPVEGILAGIWAEVLGLKQVGIHDNFFELGGHSLLATQIVSRVRSACQVELPLRTIFEVSTIASLAERLDAAQRDVPALATPPLRPVSRQGDLALSFAQQRLWFLDQLEPDSPLYNIPVALHLTGHLDLAALERSLNEIVCRHESLRTTFGSVDGQPVQIIAPVLKVPLPMLDLQELPPLEREAQARRVASEEARRPFDLAHGPLVRASVLHLAADEHVLLFNMHHIVSDGWSLDILTYELAALYPAFCAGQAPALAAERRGSPLPGLPIQYADYAAWQRAWLRGAVLDEQLAYWRQQLVGVPVLDVPTDRPRPPMQTFCGATQAFSVSPATSQALRTLAQREQVTLFILLLAAFKTLLQRYTGQEDIVVGTPIANRQRSEIEGLIGFFVNTLVLRTDLSGAPSFREALGRVRDMALGAYAHQDVPFEMVVDALQPERNLSRTPLFQVMFTLQNALLEAQTWPGLNMQLWEVDHATAMFDLTLSLTETAHELVGAIEYNTDLFDGSTIVRIAGHFQRLLDSIVADPDQRLADLVMLPEAEQQQLLVAWNATQVDYPRDRCIHELFEAQVKRAVDALAIVDADHALTYGELNRRANQLAHYLRARGVGPEVFVCVCMERSPEMVIALLGVLKAGGAYVPLDPAYPAERLAFMLKDAQPPVLLTQQRLLEAILKAVPDAVELRRQQYNCCPNNNFSDRPLANLLSHPAHVVCLDVDWVSIAQASEADPINDASAGNPAYVIYTSGSTGQPKGVLIPHRALVQYVSSAIDHFALTPQDRVLQFASISFDAAAEEIYSCLLGGATLVLRTDALLDSVATFARTCATECITLLDLPTAYWHSVTAEIETVDWPLSVRLVIIGGERAMPERLLTWQAHTPPHVRLINTYGPTEATIVATACDLGGAGRPNRADAPIGRPVANVQVYLLDANLRPVPIGVPGELFIGGDGLARGYLNRPELTAERFIPNPFIFIKDEGGGMRDEENFSDSSLLYKTGDLARYLPDGHLEFLGRVDHQVKVRGFRIELSEIEAVLGQHPQVQQAVVLACDVEQRPGDKQLVAYVVAQTGELLETRELRAWLKDKLPEYMLPAAYVMLDALPLTPSRKVDRRALPAPDWNRLAAQKSCVLPRTPIEQALAGIWTQVVGVERVSVHDNFFELGGHSLLATRITAQLRRFFGREFAVRLIFEAPTIAALAKRIEAAIRAEPEEPMRPIRRLDKGGALPLSFGQQQLWLVDQLTPGNVAYNSPFPLHVVGALDQAALQESLNEIVRRHQVLRTTFDAVEGQPVQVIAPTLEWPLRVIDLRPLSRTEREAEAQRLVLKEARHPFDLSRGPLIRATLLQLAEDEHILLLTVHHIVFDGWSLDILFDELGALYQAFSTHQPSPLSELAIQYADFAGWQREWLQGAELERRLDYWQQQLKEAPTVVGFPLDRPRPPSHTFQGAYHLLSFPKPLSDRLKVLSRQAGATLFMTLLAALKALIYRYTGQTDIVVSTVVANRNRPEIESLIGYFVNVLALRTQLLDHLTFRELLGQVRETALGAYAHQELPFEKLVERLQPKRDPSYTPFFQVMLNLQNTSTALPTLPGLSVTPMTIDPGAIQLGEMELALEETEQGLHGVIQYNTDLFDAVTIRQIQADYLALLESVTADPNQVISTLLPSVKARPHPFHAATLPTPPALDAQDDLTLQRTQLLARRANLALRKAELEKRRTRLSAEKQSLLEKRLRGAAENVSNSSSSLVPLQIGDSTRRPLFFVHPIGGSVWCYVNLAHYLGPDQPCYGLQAQGLAGEGAPLTQVEDMAQRYITSMRTVQPEGPYLLGGWSMGGVVAFEMAHQLQAQAQRVALLALIDADLPTGDAEPQMDEMWFWADLALSLGLPLDLDLSLDAVARELQRFSQLAPDERLTALLEYLKRANIEPPDIELPQVRRLFQVFKCHRLALQRYAPRTYADSIALFQAGEPVLAGPMSVGTSGWRALASGSLTVQTIPGNHYTIMREPNIEILAGQLQTQLHAVERSLKASCQTYSLQ
ncbi:MAG TPA: amino acid adenylation domain-containing protein [Anaerolineae bacterium]|nr:amino acid adenylation domain-containing protein [Anaerolineae bacterium]